MFFVVYKEFVSNFYLFLAMNMTVVAGVLLNY